MLELNDEVELNGDTYRVIKPSRLLQGVVLKGDDSFARLGPKGVTLEEQVHTKALRDRGFPVPEIIASGDYADNQWFFAETSLGEQTFHERFKAEYQASGQVSEETFDSYLAVIDRYMQAQVAPENRSSVSAEDFITACLREEHLGHVYSYFDKDLDKHQKAIDKAQERLRGAPMGILQYDLNPYNVLEGGLIDFELVGYGPIGYDALLSARWATGWWTDYPSRYPIAYRLTEEQVAASDTVVEAAMQAQGMPSTTEYLQEFLLIKSVWSCLSIELVTDEWPADKIAFARYRANLLDYCVDMYLGGEPIDYRKLSSIPGGEIEQ